MEATSAAERNGSVSSSLAALIRSSVRQSRKFIFWYFLNCAERYAGLICRISLTLSSERSNI